MKILTAGITSLLLGSAGLAGAHTNDRGMQPQFLHESAQREFAEHYDWDHGNGKPPAVGPVVAPELQPASTIAAFTLLGGGLLMLRAGGARKPKD